MYIEGGVVSVNGNTVAQQTQLYALDLAVAWNANSPAWIALKQGPTQAFHSAAISTDEQTLVTFRTSTAGSTLSYRFHINTNTWDQSSVKVQNPSKGGVSAVQDPVSGLVYLAGGFQSDDSQMYIYNIDTDTISMIPMQNNFMVDRTYYSGVYLKSRKSIIYFGGTPNNGQTSQDLVTEFVPSTGDDGSKVVVFGGRLDNGGYAKDLWILDVSTLTWTQGLSWSEARVSTTCTIAGTTFISWGGSNGQRTVDGNAILFDLNSGQYISSYTPPPTYVNIAQGNNGISNTDGNSPEGSQHGPDYDPYHNSDSSYNSNSNSNNNNTHLLGEAAKSSSLLVVGAIIGSVLLIACLALASVFVHKYRQKIQSQCISFNNGTGGAGRLSTSNSLATLTNNGDQSSKKSRYGEARDAITADEEKYITTVQSYNPPSDPRIPPV
ncbi:hypothetical protein BGX26_012287 [Mortierella sp. AD094]|nr:hypothetical protein BGX26_012287 [Mortierella sp. AD094]